MTDAFDTRAREIIENGPVIFGRANRGHYEAVIASALREADREATERERERVRALLESFGAAFPDDIEAALGRLLESGLDWGAVGPKPDVEHVSDFADSLAITRSHHGLTEADQYLNGVYLRGSETVICHTGTSPNSAVHARLIIGLIDAVPKIRQAIASAIRGE